METSQYLKEKGYSVKQRSQLSQLNPGVCEKMSEARIREEFPEEVEKHEADPYHHRYPRAEVCAACNNSDAADSFLVVSRSCSTSRACHS